MKIKKNDLILVGVIILIITAIVGISVLRKEDNGEIIDSDILQCISGKSTLYISKTCTHCARQKEILSECLDQLEVVDCTIEGKRCSENGITQVPTWVINDKKYAGLKTIDEIIELCGCAE